MSYIRFITSLENTKWEWLIKFREVPKLYNLYLTYNKFPFLNENVYLEYPKYKFLRQFINDITVFNDKFEKESIQKYVEYIPLIVNNYGNLFNKLKITENNYLFCKKNYDTKTITYDFIAFEIGYAYYNKFMLRGITEDRTINITLVMIDVKITKHEN